MRLLIGRPRILPLAGVEAGEEGGDEGGDAGGSRGALPGDCGYTLHAMRMVFEHPITHERIELEAMPAPPELTVPREKGSTRTLSP